MSGGGAGDKPPAIDQDGKMINPHNPEFITKVPWYLGNTGPTLKHHSRQKDNHELSIAETDALVLKKLAAQQEVQAVSKKTTYRKGACKNCGAMTHQEKDCLERPRSSKKAAWKSGLDIATDEVVLNMENHGKLSYAAKRDQWKGYDPAEYQELIERHNRLEEDQRKTILAEKQAQEAEQRAQKQDRKAQKAKRSSEAERKSRGEDQNGKDAQSSGSDSDSDYSDAESDAGSEADNTDDAFKQKDAHARDFQGTLIPQGGVGGNGMRITARNLRIREDTPKYLRNLSLDSAFYDPKSRSMRANPYGNVANPDTLPYAGDNFVRFSGDALQLAQNQVLCWEMQEKNGMTGGLDSIDVISNPSQAELLKRTIVAKKAVAHEAKTQAIYEKYLGADYEDKKQKMAMDSRLKLGQTESYVEYSRDGTSILKTNATGSVTGGATQATSGLYGRPLSLVGKTVTKYEEDVLQFNHTTVWGSYFNRANATWGYACCHSSMKMAYCTGEKGKLANDLASQSNAVLVTRQQEKREEKQAKATSKEKFVLQNTSDLFGSLDARQVSSLQLDPAKLQAAELRARDEGKLNKSHKDKDEDVERESTKRGYNSMQSTEYTAEDMEVYRRKRVKNEDPMAHLLGSDELLER